MKHVLPVLPLKNVVALPKSIIPVVVGREVSIRAVEQALKTNKEIFVTSQKVSDTEHPTVGDIFTMGPELLFCKLHVCPMEV